MFHMFIVAACEQPLTHKHATRHINEMVRAAILEMSKPTSELWSVRRVRKRKKKRHKAGEMKWKGGEVAADPDKVYHFSQSGLFESANELATQAMIISSYWHCSSGVVVSHAQQKEEKKNCRPKSSHTNTCQKLTHHQHTILQVFCSLLNMYHCALWTSRPRPDIVLRQKKNISTSCFQCTFMSTSIC